MSRIFTLFLFLAYCSPIFAQNLSGKWVGYFRNMNGIEEKIYPYEVNISNGAGQQINAITITRLSNQSTATAFAKGNYTPNAHLLSLQETKFEQIHLEANLQACLMNNFLTYKKENNSEILQGTYTSKNVTNGTDCGMGSVYLERDLISSINIAAKKIDQLKNKLSLHKKDTIASNYKTAASLTNKTIITKEANEIIVENTSANNKINTTELVTNQETSPPIPQNSILKQIVSETTNNFNKLITSSSQQNSKAKSAISNETIPKHEHKYIPWVLISRENVLAKRIVTRSKSMSIDIFDNGTIDNDTITIYDNYNLLIDHNRLSYKAIHFDLKFDEFNKRHEIIVIANNLGAVPPNTALLNFKDSKQNEEVPINTNFSQNAKLIIEYRPPN